MIGCLGVLVWILFEFVCWVFMYDVWLDLIWVIKFKCLGLISSGFDDCRFAVGLILLGLVVRRVFAAFVFWFWFIDCFLSCLWLFGHFIACLCLFCLFAIVGFGVAWLCWFVGFRCFICICWIVVLWVWFDALFWCFYVLLLWFGLCGFCLL